MDVIWYDLNLDFVHPISQTIRVKQHDTSGGRRLRISLYNDGTEIALNATDDTISYSASIKNVAIIVDSTDLWISDGKVIIPVTASLTRAAGRVSCEIKIISSNGQVHTATFYIIVERSVIDDSEALDSAINSSDVLENYLASYVKSTTVRTIWSGTQSQYDAILTPNSNTLYIISE